MSERAPQNRAFQEEQELFRLWLLDRSVKDSIGILRRISQRFDRFERQERLKLRKLRAQLYSRPKIFYLYW